MKMLGDNTIAAVVIGYLGPIAIFSIFALMIDGVTHDYAGFEAFMAPVAGLLSALTWFISAFKDRKLENVQAALFSAAAIAFSAGCTVPPANHSIFGVEVRQQWPFVTLMIGLVLLALVMLVTYANLWATGDSQGSLGARDAQAPLRAQD